MMTHDFPPTDLSLVFTLVHEVSGGKGKGILYYEEKYEITHFKMCSLRKAKSLRSEKCPV